MGRENSLRTAVIVNSDRDLLLVKTTDCSAILSNQNENFH